jgi:hypothetical protein
LGEPIQNGDVSTTWALLANCFSNQNALQAHSWSEVTQYFTLVSYLIQDEQIRSELVDSLTTRGQLDHQPRGFYVLAHLIDLHMQYRDLVQTSHLETPSENRAEMKRAMQVICRVWLEAQRSLGVDAPTLAAEIEKTTNTHEELRVVLKEVRSGTPLFRAMSKYHGAWQHAAHGGYFSQS